MVFLCNTTYSVTTYISERWLWFLISWDPLTAEVQHPLYFTPLIYCVYAYIPPCTRRLEELVRFGYIELLRYIYIYHQVQHISIWPGYCPIRDISFWITPMPLCANYCHAIKEDNNKYLGKIKRSSPHIHSSTTCLQKSGVTCRNWHLDNGPCINWLCYGWTPLKLEPNLVAALICRQRILVFPTAITTITTTIYQR